MPTTGDARAVSADRAPKKSKSNKIRAPLLLNLLGGSLDGDRRSLDLRCRDDKHYLTFVLEYDDRSRGWVERVSRAPFDSRATNRDSSFLMRLGFYLNLHVLNDLRINVLC